MLNPNANYLQARLRELSLAQTTSLDSLYSLDAELGETYAEVVNAALDEPIGGQTITEMLTDFADQHGIPI